MAKANSGAYTPGETKKTNQGCGRNSKFTSKGRRDGKKNRGQGSKRKR
jgi:hypothetical protein